MQTLAAYLYDQVIDVVINLDPLPNRENQLVYAKPLVIFKGIDNKIKLAIRNQDQKLQSLLDSTIVFNLMSMGELVFKKIAQPYLDDKGIAWIKFDSADLDVIEGGDYHYSLFFISGEGETSVLYADDNFNAQGQCQIVDKVYPTFIPSIEPVIGPFNNNSPSADGYTTGSLTFTNILEVRNTVNSGSLMQSFQYYATGFTGTIDVQGSMQPSTGFQTADWAPLGDTVTLSNFTGTGYSFFYGKVSMVRFKIYTATGTFNKLLYRP